MGGAAVCVAGGAFVVCPPFGELASYLQAWGLRVSAGLFLLAWGISRVPPPSLASPVILFFVPLAPFAASWLLSWASASGPGMAAEPGLRLLSAFIVAAGVLTLARERRAADVFLWGGTVFFALIACAYLWVCAFHPAGPGPNGPPFGNGNIAGGVFAAVVAWGGAFLLAPRFRGGAPRRPVLVSVLLAAAAFALWMSDSRAAWIAALFAVGLFAWVARPKHRTRIAVLMLALTLAGGLVAWRSLPDHPARTRWEYLLYETTLGYRLLIWKSALAAAMAAPWVGHGPGTFYQVFPSYRAESFFACAREGDWEPDPHNLFLGILVEQGILGLSAFAWISVLALRRGFAAASPGAAASGCAAAALLVNGAFSIAPSYPQGQLLLWLALWGACSGEEPPAAPSPRSRRLRWRGLVLALFCVFWFRQAVAVRGAWLYDAAVGVRWFQEALRRGDDAEARSLLEASAGRLGRSVRGMDRAGDRSTMFAYTAHLLGRVRSRQGDFVGAIEAYRAAQGRTSVLPIVDRQIGALYRNLGDLPRASARYAAYARVVGYRRDFFFGQGEVPASFQLIAAHRPYWAALLPALSRAASFRRWDLEIVSAWALYALRAGDPQEFARARAAADRLYEAAYTIQPFEAVAAYARIWQSIDRPRANAVMERYLGDHPDHAEAREALEILRRQAPEKREK